MSSPAKKKQRMGPVGGAYLCSLRERLRSHLPHVLADPMRSVQISVPAADTDELIAEIQHLDGVIGLSVQRGASVKPKGDVVSLLLASKTFHEIIRRLDHLGIGTSEESSYFTSDPMSTVSGEVPEEVVRDTNESTWEEMELTIARESNMGFNGVTVMVASGVLAIVGLSSNALHIVIAAMLIAPGFEPLVRVSLGIVGKSAAWKRGMIHTGKAYLALALSAAATSLFLAALGERPLVGTSTYVESGELLSYFLTIDGRAFAIALVSGIAGTILIATNRAVLTGGVMIALGLIPSISIAASALVLGDFAMAGQGLLRWLVDAGIVVVTAAAVLLWKRHRVMGRTMREWATR